jgi:hypothetical protein
MRLLAMPTSQDWHVVIIGDPLAIRHRRAAKARKIAMGIIADRAPLGAKPTSGSAARGRGFGEELPNNPEEREATIAAVHESVVGTKRTFAGLSSYGEALSRMSSDLNAIDFLSINCERFADWTLRAETCAPASINDFSREKMGWKRDSSVSENGWLEHRSCTK